jgi:hypothetical protein
MEQSYRFCLDAHSVQTIFETQASSPADCRDKKDDSSQRSARAPFGTKRGKMLKKVSTYRPHKRSYPSLALDSQRSSFAPFRLNQPEREDRSDFGMAVRSILPAAMLITGDTATGRITRASTDCYPATTHSEWCMPLLNRKATRADTFEARMQRARNEGYARGFLEAKLFESAVGVIFPRNRALEWLSTAIDGGRAELDAQRALEREVEAWDMSCRIAFLVAIS